MWPRAEGRCLCAAPCCATRRRWLIFLPRADLERALVRAGGGCTGLLHRQWWKIQRAGSLDTLQQRFPCVLPHITRRYAVAQINVAKAIVTPLLPRSVDGKREFCFSINSDTNEKLVLQAVSEEKRAEWVSVLTRVANWSNHHKGVLRKKMAWKKAWKDRYCVLNGCMLAYFASQSMKKRLGEVSLLGCDVQELPPSAVDGQRYCFELITDSKVMNLQVPPLFGVVGTTVRCAHTHVHLTRPSPGSKRCRVERVGRRHRRRERWCAVP